MTQVKRYGHSEFSRCDQFLPYKNGRYVEYGDYETLEKQNARLLEALEAWETLFADGDYIIAMSTRRPMTNADQDDIDAVISKSRAAIASALGNDEGKG